MNRRECLTGVLAVISGLLLTTSPAGAEEELCSLCGSAYPVRLLVLRPGEQDEGIRSEYEYVCPECEALLLLGEEPGFPLEEE